MLGVCLCLRRRAQFEQRGARSAWTASHRSPWSSMRRVISCLQRWVRGRRMHAMPQQQQQRGGGGAHMWGAGERGRHSRSAVGVNALPLNVPVEIEAIATIVE